MTVLWYDDRAEKFFTRTIGVDMSELYTPFVEMVKPGGHVLDAGCGSGRDAAHFKRQGFQVTAFDASSKLAQFAGKLIGQEVLVMGFEDVEWVGEFDGIWACASLLHVRERELPDIVGRLAKAAKPNCPLYMSFKQGEGEEEREGRHFTHQTQESVKRLIDECRLRLGQVWVSKDVRSDRSAEMWVNVLALA